MFASSWVVCKTIILVITAGFALCTAQCAAVLEYHLANNIYRISAHVTCILCKN